MAQNNNPTWGTFENVEDGMTVAIDNSLDQTGQVYLARASSTPRYRTVIKGQHLLLDTTGKVVEAEPGAIAVDTQLKILTWDIPPTRSVVTPQTRAAGGKATLTEGTLRDQFANNVLNAMIAANPDLTNTDDAGMFSASTVAYRFAEAMMRAAADNRANETPGSGEDTEVNADTTISGSVTIGNVGGSANPVPLTTLTKVENPKVYDEEEQAYVPVPLEVHVTGGGGGTGGDINLDDLIEALGYDDGETTQAGKLGELIAAVTAAGKIKKADVSNVGDTQAAIDSVSDILVFSDFNTIVPYKVTPSQLANRMALYDGLVERTMSSFPSALTLLMGSYYKLNVSPAPHAVTINLPAVSSDGMARIVMFHFSCVGVSAGEGGTGYSAFTINVPSGTVKKGRGSAIPVTLPDGTYEVDCVDNGSEWIIGVTEIVS